MRIAVCMVVKNEARDLAEWMAFHIAAGFTTQIIFDNNSTDATPDLILAGGRVADIRYHHWGQTDPRYQVDAYFTACHIYRHDFDWIAFIDSDELLVTSSNDIAGFLAGFHDCGGVAVNWAVYGSSGHIEFPAGLGIESFRRRSLPGFFPNRHIKSIVRPLNVMACHNPHYFELDAPYVTAAGTPLAWYVSPQGEITKGLSRDEPDFSRCRVNHYFVRSRQHWQHKMERGYPSDIARRDMAEFHRYDRNDVEDDLACRNIDLIRSHIAEIRSHLPPAASPPLAPVEPAAPAAAAEQDWTIRLELQQGNRRILRDPDGQWWQLQDTPDGTRVTGPATPEALGVPPHLRQVAAIAPDPSTRRTARTAILLRSHVVDAGLARMAERLARETELPVRILLDGSSRQEGSARPAGCIEVTRQQLTDMKLYMTADVMWRCGDYALFAARQSLPEIDFFWMIEPDVRLNFADAGDFFFLFGRHSDVDFLATRLGPAGPGFEWGRMMAPFSAAPRQCMFPAVRLSATALDFLLLRRQELSHVFADGGARGPELWPNDEAFTATTLHECEQFRCEDLNFTGIRVYDETTFSFEFPIPSRRFADMPVDGKLYHPVLESAAYLGKVRAMFEHVRRTGGPADLLRGLFARPGLETDIEMECGPDASRRFAADVRDAIGALG